MKKKYNAVIFESLHDYEDSELKAEACHTAILEMEYAYALNLLREGNLIEAYEKGARLGYDLISNHTFVDCNKRIGMYVMIFISPARHICVYKGRCLCYNDKKEGRGAPCVYIRQCLFSGEVWLQGL